MSAVNCLILCHFVSSFRNLVVLGAYCLISSKNVWLNDIECARQCDRGTGPLPMRYGAVFSITPRPLQSSLTPMTRMTRVVELWMCGDETLCKSQSQQRLLPNVFLLFSEHKKVFRNNRLWRIELYVFLRASLYKNDCLFNVFCTCG